MGRSSRQEFSFNSIPKIPQTHAPKSAPKAAYVYMSKGFGYYLMANLAMIGFRSTLRQHETLGSNSLVLWTRCTETEKKTSFGRKHSCQAAVTSGGYS